MHKHSDISLMAICRAAIFMICIFAITTGCNQRRYKPAKWRAAGRQTTLPANENATASNSRWSSLPTNRMGTLPWRNGSTLPGRGGMGGTLPMRNWSTLPGRDGMTTTLPQRQWGLPMRDRNWSTLPNRGGANLNSTLPQRQTYPEYRVPRRNWTTLPESR